MRKYNRQLKSALKALGFNARFTGHTVRIRTSMLAYRLLGSLLFLLSIGIFSLNLYRIFNKEKFQINLLIAGLLIFLASIILLFLIKGEYYIINRQIKTIRNVNSKDQRPFRFDYPPQLIIRDIEKKGKYKYSKLTFIKGEDLVETLTFNKGKFSPQRVKGLYDAMLIWLTQGQILNAPALTYDENNK